MAPRRRTRADPVRILRAGGGSRSRSRLVADRGDELLLAAGREEGDAERGEHLEPARRRQRAAVVVPSESFRGARSLHDPYTTRHYELTDLEHERRQRGLDRVREQLVGHRARLLVDRRAEDLAEL